MNIMYNIMYTLAVKTQLKSGFVIYCMFFYIKSSFIR